jgi:putative FmdB family regulatory protein
MPLYDFKCQDCGKTCELLLAASQDKPVCPHCSGKNLKKLMAAHANMSGSASPGFPGPNDTACCGSAPGQASGCAGPGTCCGHPF